MIHLRDARNMLLGVRNNQGGALAKATILLAAAALESNLAYLSRVALTLAELRPNQYERPQIDYLASVEKFIDQNGSIRTRPTKQSLLERLVFVPQMLARSVDRNYDLPKRSVARKKLERMIQLRDAIVHPRWDRYFPTVGWWDAAECVDAVELYLETVRHCMHPYLVGYFVALNTVPGHDKHEVDLGYRTSGRGRPATPVTIESFGIGKVLLREWTDAIMLVELALWHGCEGDSNGSMFTRSALVAIYGMLDAQLSAVVQWRMREAHKFEPAELVFLNEFAIAIGHDGEVRVAEDQHAFKTRVKAVPAILARRIEGEEITVDLGTQWGERLLRGYDLRKAVMHSPPRTAMARISMDELIEATEAVVGYFTYLRTLAPKSFEYLDLLLPLANTHMAEATTTMAERRRTGAIR